MKASLQNLPVEVLSEILGHFCPHCRGESQELVGVAFKRENPGPRLDRAERSWFALDRVALSSLSISCKALRPLAQGILHHEFLLGSVDAIWLRADDFDNRLAPFMRTVVRRRDLAARVRKVTIHPLPGMSINVDQLRDLLLESATVLGIDLVQAWKRRAEEASAAIGTGRRDRSFQTRDKILRNFLKPRANARLRGRLGSGSPIDFRFLGGELISMFIALLPNMDHLSLWQHRLAPLYLRPEAFRSLGITGLPKLKTFETDANPHTLLALSPGLETLNIREYLPSPNQDFDLPNLKTLRLAGMACKKYNLLGVLPIISRCTGGLSAFLYEEKHLAVDGRDLYNFTPSQVVDALKPHRETLETLHLHNRKIDYKNPPNPTFFGLNDFSSLQRLHVSTPAIFSSPPGDLYTRTPEKDRDRIWSRIPSSIVSLHLLDAATIQPERVQEGLIGLGDMKKAQPEMFPRLVQLHLVVLHKLDEAVDHIMDAAGIALTAELFRKPAGPPSDPRYLGRYY
ncbi:uncharacterized protein NECHADRAFT_78491 [Fusarium vanettenii 77-13-4]|uniref:F-box domain-containing protein n=1 Tax=Fusarium vanettenii (strain ATCC MYA-4622 / CBS 123669 / FGSC 9596 / NRRL 45880 / 77-13-4) TaxID=660122 RepID=C7ZFF6_FUSV7|nr:uncharacterized protein NECHADRAFT_78491 [Fusarium vanettenii 77-13-4]EEU37237.1 hypothetical protein NECHADRAFT_78491 [Fusarium vanettenii 77-13-4]